MEKPNYNLKKISNPRDKRLAREHMRLDELCAKAERISYQSINNRSKKPPDTYLVTYILKSIVGRDSSLYPLYGFEHVLEINLPMGYPNTAGAKCYMQSPVWHPNVKWDGRFKGRVCVNAKGFGNLYYIDDLVLRVGKILQYQNYHALNEQPFPEDEKVAQWVREFAEPQGIVNKEKEIYVDPTSLIGPIPDSWDNNEPGEESGPPDDTPPPPPPTPEQPIITTPSGMKIKAKRVNTQPKENRNKISIFRKDR